MSEPAPSFDQADIDALFGDVAAAPAPRQLGVRALIDTDVADHQRMPMLEVVCDRMLRGFATSMRQLTADPMEVGLVGVSGGRFGDILNRAALPAMFGLFRIDPWGSPGVIAIEPGLIYAAVDALLGGRNLDETSRPVEGRAFTSIETSLVGRLMERILADFGAAFTSIAAITTALERIETSPRFAAVVGPAIVTAQCSFRIDLGGRGGHFSLLLPTTTLEPVRETLGQRFASERGGGGDWSAAIEAEVRRLPLSARAVLASRTMRLREVEALAVGDHLPLGIAPDAPACLAIAGRRIASVSVGRRAGIAALRLHHPIGSSL